MTEEFNHVGFIPAKPRIVPASTWRVIGKADPEEVWVPLPASRSSSVALLMEISKRMGFINGAESGDK